LSKKLGKEYFCIIYNKRQNLSINIKNNQMILYKINNPQFFGWLVGYILISLYRKFNNLEIDPITGKNYDLTWEQTLKALIAPIRANPLIFIILCLIDLYCNLSSGSK